MHSLSCELRRGSSESYEVTETPRTALSLHEDSDYTDDTASAPVAISIKSLELMVSGSRHSLNNTCDSP